MVKTGKGSAVVTLPSETEILITREFDAPRHLVYRAWTTPELVRRWWHANRGTCTSTEIDLRVGGKWRWVMVTESGFEVAFHGEYREIVPNEKLVYTEVYEGAPSAAGGGEDAALNTLTFTSDGARTRLTNLVRTDSRAIRDAIMNSGMEAGMQDAFDLLEQVAQSLA
ncbi:MAG TPA: SRPBCC family protein [Gemmatimonadaceae bacterium]